VRPTVLLRVFFFLILSFLLTASLCKTKPPEPGIEIENISNNQSESYYPCIACSRDGRVALAWSDYTTGWEEIWLVEKERDGQWTEPFNLSRAGTANGSRGVSLCFDPDGTLHAAWSQGVRSGWAIVYTQRPLGGEWSVPETLFYGTPVEPYIGVDASGRVHLLFMNLSGTWTVCYANRDPAGGWSSVQKLSVHYSPHGFAIAVFDDGTVIAVWDDWTKFPLRSVWSERTSSGEWSPPRVVYDTVSGFCLPVLASNGSVAALAVRAEYYHATVMTRQRDGDWSEPDTFCRTRNAGALSIAVDRQGRVFLGFDNAGEPALRLARRSEGWTQVKVNDSLFPSSTTLAVDGDGRAHLAWSSEAYTFPDGYQTKDIFYVEIFMDSLR
jgi:hypothetical protein